MPWSKNPESKQTRQEIGPWTNDSADFVPSGPGKWGTRPGAQILGQNCKLSAASRVGVRSELQNLIFSGEKSHNFEAPPISKPALSISPASWSSESVQISAAWPSFRVFNAQQRKLPDESCSILEDLVTPEAADIKC